MLKLCGTVLTFGASAILGFSLHRRLQRRVQVLESVSHAFSMLRSEIAFLQTPLPQAAEKIADATGDAVFAALAKFLSQDSTPQEAMRCTLAVGKFCLLGEDEDVLVHAAMMLGKNDAEAQQHHISAVIERLGTQLAQAKAAAQTNGRLYIAAGVLGGMMLVILLL